MMREQVIQAVEKEKIITIVRGVPREKLIPLAEAMYAGGIRLLEVTYDATGKTSPEQTAERIGMLAKHFAGRMLVGAGTVLAEKQVELTHAAGGLFIISPDANPAVIKRTRELGLVSMPGCLTPTEIQAAHLAGADFIKLFPITNLGIDYVKAVRAPLSHVKFLAVGGIHDGNMADYLRAGICGFGIGSNIVDKKLLESNDFDAIRALAERYTSLVK